MFGFWDCSFPLYRVRSSKVASRWVPSSIHIQTLSYRVQHYRARGISINPIAFLRMTIWHGFLTLIPFHLLDEGRRRLRGEVRHRLGEARAARGAGGHAALPHRRAQPRGGKTKTGYRSTIEIRYTLYAELLLVIVCIFLAKFHTFSGTNLVRLRKGQ